MMRLAHGARWARLARWGGELLLVVCVFSASLSVFLGAKAKLDSDEGEWIGTTRYFQTYFVEHDFSQAAWADDHWTRTQPMVLRYVMGSWLWLRGHDLAVLNPNYDYSKTIQANRRIGQAPPEQALEDARTVTRTMAALAVTMLYLVVRVLAGPVGGIVGGVIAATMATGSPYLQENLIRAKAESTLMFFLLGALLFAILSLRRAGSNWPGTGWGVLTGLFLGLAFGTKLTTILPIMAVTLWGAAACLDARFRGKALTPPPPLPAAGEGELTRGRAARRGSPWVWPTAVLVMTAAVFIGSNPFTWPDPVGRTWLLFENRRFEMSQQQEHVPSRAVFALSDRARIVWERSVWNDAFAPSRFGGKPVEAVLTIVGGFWLAVLAVRSSRQGVGPQSVELLVFLWLALLWLGVSLGLGFLLQHYFVPTATIAILLSGLVIGWSVQLAWALGWRLLHRLLHRATPMTAPVSLPAVKISEHVSA